MKNEALFNACRSGDILLFKEALLNTPNLNIVDSEGWAPLHYASENGFFDIISLLINNGADVNFANPSGFTPYHILMMCEHYNHNIVNEFYNAGAVMGSKLHVAILLNDTSEINRYISKLELINSIDEIGNTPLHIAVAINRNDLILPLINAGARVNKADIFSSTPLHECSATGNLFSLKLLLSMGGDPNMKDYNGRNSLILAAGNGQGEIVKTLLNFGIDIDLQDNFGNTALHYAYENEEYMIVKSLLEHNASTEIKNEDGLVPELLSPH